ncbi:unnamed protein product [Callosobruchus maculatus]|uniref:Ran-GTPase activating protein 1 C-terminal domain-containing protein n=1 Tax=Callosobruchus maculatus TaxID=64391 RepID=A0A653DWU1_CALMS|nr:unnamed protein product [Callosobruchus maculatus]
MANVDSLTEALQKTKVSPNGVSFAGKSLKLDNEEHAKEVTEAINNCTDLEYLNLEGNTLGVNAAKAVAKALEKHPELKRALWKDMFTGRMKTEIPKALEHLGNGLVTAGTRLVELDLSDNAFGPIGVEGLAALLRSSSCYALEELRLNNNGLGITGGKLLAAALTDCYKSSKEHGKPLSLKVFIAGRNRLENDGAIALAQVFKMIGTLEEIAMPQNGIYHVGIKALSEAFVHNKNLRVLNLNDNTIGSKGADHIAEALPHLQALTDINFGDCLLKTKGASRLAEALTEGHKDLKDLQLGYNEIRVTGALLIAGAIKNKIKINSLQLDGNQFGEEGKAQLETKLKEFGKLHVLGSLDENESEDSEEEVEEDENENSSERDESADEAEHSLNSSVTITEITDDTKISVKNFIKNPNVVNFMALGDNRSELIFEEIKTKDQQDIDSYVEVLMKISALSNNSEKDVSDASANCAEYLYKQLFIWAQQEDHLWPVMNSLLINLGLLKGEDKKFKPTWNLEGCFTVLKTIIPKNYFPESIRKTIKLFIQSRLEKNGGDHLVSLKNQIITSCD